MRKTNMDRRSYAFMKLIKQSTLLKTLAVIVLFFQINSFAQTTVQYIYDNNGRLRAVTYPDGEAAVYEYDAEGNILSIRRELNSTLSILYFSPDRGRIGDTVQIIGTGFSTNPSENTVKFNGTTAIIQSASLTQLTVSVPVGSTTGNITITNSLGTVTSTSVFSVIEVPVILDFTPKLGKWGDAISISGDKFATLANDNSVKFNGTSATISQSTTSTITTQVPDLATSGKIAITNQAGEDESDEDFFVVPNEVTTANVFHTSRLTLNQSQNVLFNQSDKVALLVFDGVAGQSVSLKVIVPTSIFGGLILPLNLSVNNPNGSSLVQPTPMSSLQRGLYLEPFTLPVTGTYTIILDKTPYPTGLGNANIQVFNIPDDVSGNIEIDGASVDIANTVPGQNARLTFNGSAGQKINLLGEVLQVGNNCNFSILNPNGSTLVAPVFGSNNSTFGNDKAFAENITLPTNGVYTIFINQSFDGVFASRVRLSSPPSDVTATITADGSDTNVTTTIPGENMEVTFNGIIGQRISLKVTSTNTNGILNYSLTIEQPNGVRLLNNQFVNSSYFFDATTLTQNGIYKIKLNPSAEEIGTVKINLYTVPANDTESLTIGGLAGNLNIGTPGQNAVATFEGVANQKVAINFSEVALNGTGVQGGQITIRSPQGTILNSFYLLNQGRLLENLTLPNDGTYTITLDPPRDEIGSTKIQIFDMNVSNIAESITVDGSPLNLDFSVPFQKAQVTFTGTVGQTLLLAFSNVNVSSSKLSILKPDGTAFLSNLTVTPSTTSQLLNNLPVSGTYTILIDPDLLHTGQMTLILTSVGDINTSITMDGSPASVSLVQGQNANITFTGNAGQRAFVKFSGANSTVDFTITQPNGTVLHTSAFSSDNGYDFNTLPETGTYTIRATNNPFQQTDFQVSVASSALISQGSSIIVKFLNPNQTVNVNFQADGGTGFNLIIPNTSFSNGTVNVYDANGNLLTSANIFDFFVSFNTQTTGIHRIEIVPAQNETGYVELLLSGGGGGGDSLSN